MSNPLHGRPLAQRLRLGPVELDRYIAERLGGLSYMRRLRAIEDKGARELRLLDDAWRALAAEEGMTDAAFVLAWREAATSWDFRRLNELVARHNEYYPIEARVPMNPRTGDYAKSWRRRPYDAAWILARFPASRDLVPIGTWSRPAPARLPGT
jgi:hypothetical protein